MAASIDSLVPKAPWFWDPLQRYCVVDCCGLAAFNFSTDSVAWTCHLGEATPQGNDWRVEEIGDPLTLAGHLRAAAGATRRLDAEAVSASLFNEILAPEGYATLFEDLARKIELALDEAEP